MPPDVAVRTPDPDEIDDVADMWVSLAADQRGHGSHILADVNRAVARESLAHLLVGDGLRVAVADDPVGFVSFALDTGRYEQDRSRGVVRHLYVAADHRGRGVGGRLLAAAEEALASAGAEVVALEAMAENAAARRFYSRRGYTPHRVELEKRVESDTRRG